MQSPTEILERLEAGNARFAADRLDAGLRDSKRRRALRDGQSPYAVVLSCADSRVVPELAFDAGLGELFVVRVAGNVANTSTIASIEYAVARLGTSVVVVMGHEGCGAVTAAIDGGDGGYNLNHLLAHITPARDAAEDASVEAVVRKNAALTALELTRRSGIMSEAVDAGRLTIVPAYYELASGKVAFPCRS